MNRIAVQLIVVGLFMLLFGYLSFKVIQPFLGAIAWAVVLAIVSFPLYAHLLRWVKHESFASALNLLIILVLILGPATYFMYLLVNETVALAQHLQQQNAAGRGWAIPPDVERFMAPLLSTFGINQGELTSTVVRYATELARRIAGEMPRHAMVVMTTVLDLFLMSVVLFFLPIHGPRLLEAGLRQIPLAKKNRDKFKELVRDVVISTIYGGLFSAVAHGALAFVTFVVAAVPSPVLLGLSAAFSSALPAVGSFVVWFGVALYLFLTGHVAKAIILAVIAILGTQVIDHLLRPWLSRGRANIPFVVVLFGIMGGLLFFGFAGFVVGPLVLAVFVALVRLFAAVRGETKQDLE